MLIDAHVHVFPPEFSSQREKLLSSEPYFGTLFGHPAAPLGDAEGLMRMMDREGVARAVVCAFPWRDAGRARAHNDYILDASRRFSGRLVPLAAVDPLSPAAAEEASRALSTGASGLGEVGAYHDDVGSPVVLESLTALGNLCAEAGRPLLLHTNEPVGRPYPGKSPMTLAGLQRLLERCPRTRFQLAHLGGGIFFFLWLKRGLKRLLEHCIADTAALPFLFRPRVLRYLAESSVPLAFGSDWPLLGPERYRREFAKAGLPPAALNDLWGNTAAAFWLAEQVTNLPPAG